MLEQNTVQSTLFYSVPHPMQEVEEGIISPVTGLEWPRGFQEVNVPDFMTMAQDGGKVVSLMHRPPLPPGNAPGTHFC